MSSLIDLLAIPLLVCVVLVGIHCQFGIQVLKRSVVFVDLALAQCAALGATVAFMQGHLPQSAGSYAWSLGFAWGGALLLSLVRFAPSRIPHEALVGVVYVASASAALLLIEQAPQGAEHLKQILSGSILTVSADELTRVVPIYAVVGILLWVATSRGWFERKGFGGWACDLFFYAAFGLVVTSSVALAGVLLVFSFLIVPALAGLLFASKPLRQLAIGWAVGIFAAAAGLAASYVFDTSTGATMVCAFSLFLIIALGCRALADSTRALTLAFKGLVGFAVAIAFFSVAWLCVQPKADQPLLDVAEALFPALRVSYFNEGENAIYDDAQAYLIRYTKEAARLNAMESRGRWDAPLDDETVRKISSFEQSYNEMIKGEQFVMKETRGRARERLRMHVALSLLGLIVAALFWFSLRRVGVLKERRATPSTTVAH